MKVLRRNCDDLIGKRILELGGGGHNYRLLSLNTWAKAEVSALDFSELSLQQLAELFKLHSKTVRLIQADIFQAPDPTDEAAYDVVCHWGVIEHFQPPEQILEASRKFLKPGGLLVFSLPNLNAWGAKFFKRYSPECWATHYPYRVEELTQALTTREWSGVKFQFFGYPAFKYAPWESSNRILKALNILQKVGILSSFVLPYHRWGSEKFSLELMVLARRVA